jgi:hypothetical protein
MFNPPTKPQAILRPHCAMWRLLLFQPKTSYNDNEVVHLKRLILLVVLVVIVIILAGSSASAVSDSDTSPTYGDISTKEIATTQTEASDSSASATITITMYTGDDE